MISLGTFFWLMIIFFAIVGAMRGWTKEVIATSGLILSLFTLDFFGEQLISLLQTQGGETNVALQRQQFYIMSLIHLVFAFFSYQGPAIAGTRLGDRLRVRDSIQDKFMGAIIGAINGYLIIGGIWAFLEMNLDAAGNYPFDLTTLTRPGMAPYAPTLEIIANLPLPLLAPYLPILVVVVFLFVIVVLI